MENCDDEFSRIRHRALRKCGQCTNEFNFDKRVALELQGRRVIELNVWDVCAKVSEGKCLLNQDLAQYV
ncbi:MAG: hypothetical protein FWE16_06150 [Firmicutes bacterium]|nr:hypothetical protein [Bacillota bacterium]